MENSKTEETLFNGIHLIFLLEQLLEKQKEATEAVLELD